MARGTHTYTIRAWVLFVALYFSGSTSFTGSRSTNTFPFLTCRWLRRIPIISQMLLLIVVIRRRPCRIHRLLKECCCDSVGTENRALQGRSDLCGGHPATIATGRLFFWIDLPDPQTPDFSTIYSSPILET